MPLSREWTRVTMQGRYAADATLLVRNRPFDGTYGYEVLVPFRDAAGGTVLVDRGWVQNAQTAETPPDVVPAPTGDVTVTGWLRRSEPSLGKSLPRGQLASINLAEASSQVGSPLLGAYIILEVERLPDGTAPATTDGPGGPRTPTSARTRPTRSSGGWRMVAGFVLVWFGARREYREGLELAAPEGTPRPARRCGSGTRRTPERLAPSGGDVGAAALLVGELRRVEVVVEPAALEQLAVRAALDDPALVDDEDLVGPAHGRQPVGDDDRRPAFEGGVEGPLHGGLRLAVEVGGGLVEDDQARSLEQQPREGQSLLLAAGQAVSAVAHDGVEPLGERPHQ